MKKRAHLIATNPVARAAAVQRWTETGVDAQIHAILGSDVRTLCNLAGRMFYVVLGAAIAERLDSEEPDLQLVREGVDIVYDIADGTDVPEESRAPIISGLEAVKRLAACLKARSLADSHFDLQRKLAAGDVRMSDFDALKDAAA